MEKPFRWNIEKRNELGSLVNDNPNKISDTFFSELVGSSAKIISFSDNSRLFFVGRSPENYFDFLKGIYSGNDEKLSLLHLFQFSGRFEKVSAAERSSILGLRTYMSSIDLSPNGILKSEKKTALVDLVYSGSTMKNLITVIKEWAAEEKKDWNAIKRKLRIVGITERTKNSPNTWRWQEQAESITVLDGIKVKNVSVPWSFWSELGNIQSKVTPSNPPEKWAEDEPTKPSITASRLEGLNFAYNLNSLGKTREAKDKLKKEMQKQNEMTSTWFKDWFNSF